MFKMLTGCDLNLDKPKTLNEKIQWLKLYDNSPLKTQLTDKILVRDWVREKIGEEYLKPVFCRFVKLVMTLIGKNSLKVLLLRQITEANGIIK